MPQPQPLSHLRQLQCTYVYPSARLDSRLAKAPPKFTHLLPQATPNARVDCPRTPPSTYLSWCLPPPPREKGRAGCMHPPTERASVQILAAPSSPERTVLCFLPIAVESREPAAPTHVRQGTVYLRAASHRLTGITGSSLGEVPTPEAPAEGLAILVGDTATSFKPAWVCRRPSHTHTHVVNRPRVDGRGD